MHELALVTAGLVVGLVVGMTGVGGGSLLTPLLILAFGIKPDIAVGTDLLFAATTKASGTLSLWRRALVPWRVVGLLSAGSVPAAAVTLAFLSHLGPASAAARSIILHTLGVTLVLTALATFYRATFARPPAPTAPDAQDSDPSAPRSRLQDWLTVAFGATIGVLVTLTSVGAGAIGVTALIVLYPRLALPRIVAADIAYAVPLTLVGGLGHASLGTVDWPLLALLLTGALPGILLGTHLTERLPPRATRLALSVLVAWAGLSLVAKA
jgi:uncharacterized membrane protein YfcA